MGFVRACAYAGIRKGVGCVRERARVLQSHVSFLLTPFDAEGLIGGRLHSRGRVTGKVHMDNWNKAGRALVAALGSRAVASLVVRLSGDLFDMKEAATSGGRSLESWVSGHRFLESGECIREALDGRWYPHPLPGSIVRYRVEKGDAARWLALGLNRGALAVAASGSGDARGLLYWSVLDVACALLRRGEPGEVVALAEALKDACGLSLCGIADASRAYLYPVDVTWQAGTLVGSGGAA
jgi:hypothetical protein